MEVILLERIVRLGQMGEVVRVRDGYARNFLLPQGKALRANESNRMRFEEQRVQYEARDLERRTEAEEVASKLEGHSFVVVRQAGETGQLYGSVTARDLAEVVGAAGFSIDRSQIALNQPIKTIGMHDVRIALHAEVDAAYHGQRGAQRGRGGPPGAWRGRDKGRGGGGGRGGRSRRSRSGSRSGTGTEADTAETADEPAES